MFLSLGETCRTEDDSEKSHCHRPGPGYGVGCRAEKALLALCGSGLCSKPVAAILIALYNTEIPLTLLLTHRLPGYREQQQRHGGVERWLEHLCVWDLQS